MWDFAIRFPFGEQPAPLQNEGTFGAATATLTLQREGTFHKKTPSGNLKHVLAEHTTSKLNSPIVSTTIARWSFDSERHKFKVKQELLRKTQLQCESDDFRPINDAEESISDDGSRAKLLIEAEQFAQSATHLTLTTTEHTEMEPLLAPVLEKLKSLKATTPDSLPPYNPRLRAKKHLQVLKTRLLPVGKHILHVLSRTSEENRGLLELKLCRHIAAKHWPLPLDTTTHLRIQEMYHNDIFTSSSQMQTRTLYGVSTKVSGDKKSSMEGRGGTPIPYHDLSAQSSLQHQLNHSPTLRDRRHGLEIGWRVEQRD